MQIHTHALTFKAVVSAEIFFLFPIMSSTKSALFCIGKFNFFLSLYVVFNLTDRYQVWESNLSYPCFPSKCVASGALVLVG